MTNSIDIKPNVGMYRVLKHIKYSPWFALAEFVDNSLQSFLAKNGKYGITRDVCEVEITYEPNENYLTITDNAYGISENEHQRAFTAGIPPSNRTGLSEFGVGMKSAGIWFSPNWTVKTQAIESEKEYEFVFDLDQIVKNDGSIEPLIGSATAKKGYTEINLTNLNHRIKGRTLSKIKDHLRSIYRCFIREKKLKLTFNGEELIPSDPMILKAVSAFEDEDKEEKEWKKLINFEISNGCKVRGFVAIRERGSFSLAGLSLFRRNRLIVGSDEEKFKPKEIFGTPNSFTSLRVFGEIHLEGMEVSHTKDQFNFGEYEEEFIDLLKEQMDSKPKQIIRQAEKYRAKNIEEKAAKSLVSMTKKATQGLRSEVQNVAASSFQEKRPETFIEKVSDIVNPSKEEKFAGISKTVTENKSIESKKLSLSLEEDSTFEFKIAGIQWNITVGLTDENEKALYSVEFMDKESAKPQSKEKNTRIVINKNHSLLLKFCNNSKEALGVLISLILTLSTTELILVASGHSYARLIRKSFNELIDKVIKGIE